MSKTNRADTYVISDLQQIKALADPLRQKILGAFVKEPRTTMQVAILLGQPPTKLYHHVDQLERAGLIELVETKPKRGTTERYLQAIAHRFAVDETCLGGEARAVIGDTLADAFTSAQTEIRHAINTAGTSSDGTQRTILALGALRIAPEDLPELQQRIMDIAREMGGERHDTKREFYRYLVAVYPSTDESDS